MRDKCSGICDINERVNCYKKWIQYYSDMVFVLFTLRHTFKNNQNFLAQIEPNISGLGRPDLLVIDLENKEGAAIDHKIIKTSNKEYIIKEMNKVKKYQKDNIRIFVKIKKYPQEIPVSIKDTVIIGPSNDLDNTIRNLSPDEIPVPIITYTIRDGNVKLTNRTKGIFSFNSTPMKYLFPRGQELRKIPIPDEAFAYKFILEEPPLGYLLFHVYNTMITIRRSYVEKEIEVTYTAVKTSIDKFYPRFFTTHDLEADQINDSRLRRAWGELKKLKIIEMKGEIAKVKLPQGSPLDYILRKLAKYEISKDSVCIKSQAKTTKTDTGLLKWLKPRT